MEVFTINFNSSEVKKSYSDKRKAFNRQTNISNIVYLFFENDNCYYIGETKASLYDRCFVNTPCHIDTDWFSMCNKVIIIKLDDELGDIERRALEATFILSYKSAGHPLANKK